MMKLMIWENKTSDKLLFENINIRSCNELEI